MRLDISPERAARILNMTRRGSASHAAWLTFMLPRLSFARDLLTDDGVIFISIDDNEQANLKNLCDEVFGEECFVAQFIWQRRTSPDMRKIVSTAHDYILAYVKEGDCLDNAINQAPLCEDDIANYSNPDNDPRGPWASSDFTAQGYRPNQMYEITTPGGAKYFPPEGKCWKNIESEYQRQYEEGRFWFGQDGCGVPRRKTYLNEKVGKNVWTWWKNSEVGHSQEATQEVKALFDGHSYFDYPKPLRLIKRILQLGTNKDSIIVDFFSGSGTTANAVMQLNAEDGGNRSYIMVQIPEMTPEKSEAFKAGYKTIDQIGMERIKRAAKKIKEANPLFSGDLGFKHYTLEEPKQDALLLMEQFDPISNNITTLSVDDFGLETVLRTWLVADGYGLTEDAEEVLLGRYKAYWKGDHLYLINPDHDFDASSIAALMDKYNGEQFSPHNIVIFGYSFSFTHREELQKNLRTLKEGNKTLTVNLDVRY